MYKAYLWAHDGKQLPGYVQLEEDEIVRYFQVQASMNPSITVVDENDMVVAKMVDRKLVFPEVENEIVF